MEQIYDLLENANTFFVILFFVACVWEKISARKLYCRLNNPGYIHHHHFLVISQRRAILACAVLPPWSALNILLLGAWYYVGHCHAWHKWELVYTRLRFRLFEKSLLERYGVERLADEFEKVVKDIGKFVRGLEPGSSRYNLASNFYIQAQRRLKRMRNGESFGHFPIPK